MEDWFKFLWPFQNVRTLINWTFSREIEGVKKFKTTLTLICESLLNLMIKYSLDELFLIVLFVVICWYPSSHALSIINLTNCWVIQVNLFQKQLFLHQLTLNMTKDCSWNYHENYKRRTWAEHVLPNYKLVVFMVIPWTIFCHIVG